MNIPTSLAELQAVLQTRVGVFLGCKEKIYQMTRSSVLTIQDQANELLKTQNELEAQLPGVLIQINEASAGMSDIQSVVIGAGGVYANIELHMKSVNDLWSQYNSLDSSGISSIWLIVGAIGLFAWWKFRKK